MFNRTHKYAVLIANREHARLFRYDQGVYEEMVDFDAEVTHLTDTREDIAGVADKVNAINQHDTEVFIRNVSADLFHIFPELKVEHLIIVAPGSLQNQFKKNLHKDLQDKLYTTIDANIVNFQTKDLKSYTDKALAAI